MGNCGCLKTNQDHYNLDASSSIPPIKLSIQKVTHANLQSQNCNKEPSGSICSISTSFLSCRVRPVKSEDNLAMFAFKKLIKDKYLRIFLRKELGAINLQTSDAVADFGPSWQFESVHSWPIEDFEQLQVEDGSMYIGDVGSAQIRQGKGICYFTDGSVYEGDWANDKPNGKGRFVFSSGDFYNGEFKNGVFEGIGFLVHVNVSIFSGHWHDGKAEGYGTEVHKTNMTYEGYYIDGKRHGKGKLMFEDGSYYIGDFKDDMIHGVGKKVWPDGSWYNGEWLQEMRHGWGKQVYSDGTYYEGEFANDTKVEKMLLES